ncbi:FtsX-like permease family protein [Glycocaulis profundi]|nr:FtsX-like permease family protein [Glycocaulis profundi]
MRRGTPRFIRETLTGISLVTLAGLTAAFAGFMLVLSLLQYERNFNRAADPDFEVQQVFTQMQRPGQDPIALEGGLTDLAPALRAALPDIHAARLWRSNTPRTVQAGSVVADLFIAEADPAIANVIRFPAPAEEIHAALSSPDGAVLTTPASRILFGEPDARGRTFLFQDRVYRVALVMPEFPEATSFHRDQVFISSLGEGTNLGSADRAAERLSISIGGTQTFVRARSSDTLSIDQISRAANRHAEAVMARFLASAPNAAAASMTLRHHLIPIRRLESAAEIGASPDSNRFDAGAILVLTLVIVLVLMVAALNAANLKIAQILAKAVDLSIHRAYGAARTRIAGDILRETAILSLAAALAGVCLAAALSGWFSGAIGRDTPRLPDGPSLLLIIASAGCAGLVIGVYAAFAATYFRPARVLSARDISVPGARTIRTVLVAVQVAVSSGALVFGLAVTAQLHFLTGPNLGFDPSALTVYRMPEALPVDDPRRNALRSMLAQHPHVAGAAVVGTLPSEGVVGNVTVTAGSESVNASTASVDETYFEVMGLAPLAGRLLRATDAERGEGQTRPSRGLASNRLARLLGFDRPEEAIGALVRDQDGSAYEIVGVVGDLPVGRIRGDRPPTLYLVGGAARFLVARTQGDHDADDIDQIVRAAFPQSPIDRFSMTQRVDNAYLDLIRLRGIIFLCGTIIVVTSAIGVWAMALNRARQMRKEVAVRKSFGARELDMAGFFVARARLPIAGGLVTGASLGSIAAARWLGQFAEGLAFTAIYPAVGIAVTLLVVIAASALEVVKLARSRPVEALHEA